MYLDFLVKVPTVKGKITRRKKSNVVYIEYEYDRVYDPSRKYTFPKRVTIGKLSDTDPELMKPNQNFLKYFPDAELPESKNRTSRSSCLRVGTYFVLRKIIEECSLNDILGRYFGSRDMGLFLDLAVYSIIAENNAAQYYPDYTYNHPLFTESPQQALRFSVQVQAVGHGGITLGPAEDLQGQLCHGAGRELCAALKAGTLHAGDLKVILALGQEHELLLLVGKFVVPAQGAVGGVHFVHK